MARVNIYLPDDLARRAKDAGLNISSLTQEALRAAIAASDADAWLDDLTDVAPTGATHDDVVDAVRQARDGIEAGA